MSLLKRLFRKEKRRVYLGSLAVAPRKDIKRFIDQWGLVGAEDLDQALLETLRNVFDLPPASEVTDPKKLDFGLDVIVPKFQSGDTFGLDINGFPIPLFWRPKIELAARLYYLTSGKTYKTSHTVIKISWTKYVSRLFSPRGIFRVKPLFDSNDLNILLLKACSDLLVDLRKLR